MTCWHAPLAAFREIVPAFTEGLHNVFFANPLFSRIKLANYPNFLIVETVEFCEETFITSRNASESFSRTNLRRSTGRPTDLATRPRTRRRDGLFRILKHVISIQCVSTRNLSDDEWCCHYFQPLTFLLINI